MAPVLQVSCYIHRCLNLYINALAATAADALAAAGNLEWCREDLFWRRGWDSNPRSRNEIPLFESGAFNHSATSPHHQDQGTAQDDRLRRPRPTVVAMMIYIAFLDLL